MTRPAFREIADRVWVHTSAWYDLNVVVIRGDAGLVVVDTHGSEAEGQRIVADIRRLGIGEITMVVNTHEHFDHTFGNGAFRAAYGDIPIVAHEAAAANTTNSGEYFKRTYVDEPGDDYAEEVRASTIVPADQTFVSARVIDLGDRQVELIHPGRGHSAGDAVVYLADADVVLAGDLVEESGPPVYGVDSWPMDWPPTLDVVLGTLRSGTVIVPGHGAAVDRGFVEEQRNQIGIVAETIRDASARGLGVEAALAQASWPFDAAHLADGVRRGLDQLAEQRQSHRRQLPLL
ncbi:MAG: MBL fold metallo-hydrolase [Nocardioides sp.]